MNLLLLAAEKAAPMQFDWVPHVMTIVVFLATLLILGRLVWPKITSALDARESKILEEIQSAEEARAQAKSALETYQRSLAEAEQQAQQMIAKAKADAQSVAADLRSRNESDIADLKARAMREIQLAQQAAVKEVYAQASQLSGLMASKILQREISVADQQRIVEEAMQQLDQNLQARRN
ncbi:MAG: F0F1 ATP synthase subunit B [Phycisphaerales bacterium]|nr:F0F1 ATP synthase subunit B [Phycisphaerales bacterium]